MATKIKYEDAVKSGYGEFIDLFFKKGGDAIGQMFDGYNVTDVPKEKHSYYVRHKEDAFSDPASVKRDKGPTVNFMGTLVTEQALNFGFDEDLVVDDWGWIDRPDVYAYELAPFQSIDKAQEVADRITGIILTSKFGERFTSTDDITTDKEMDDAWEHYNEVVFGFLMNPFLRFNKISDVGGDWVMCMGCNTMLLLPRFADKCPECHGDNCLAWINDCGWDKTEYQLKKDGYEVCGTTYAPATEFFSDETLADIASNW